MSFDLLDVIRANISSDPRGDLQQQRHSDAAKEGGGDSEVRTVGFELDSLQLAMDLLEDGVRHLYQDGGTEFLGRKRNSFRTRRSSLPKGMKSKTIRR